MSPPPKPSTLATTLADINPASTVTPEMFAMRLTVAADADADADASVAATLDAPPVRPSLPFEGLRSTRLPRIDVRLRSSSSGGMTPDNQSDLVVRKLLAEGGMGSVYLAEQRSLAREVAIKAVRDPSDKAQLDALLWEGAIAGHLDHPGVTPIHLVGTSSDGQTILVMKRIVGLRWTDLIAGGEDVWERFPMLSKDRLRAHLEILMEVSRTIHFAHKRGVLHLDIKPDNVMIGELGEVYVVDWGIATMTRTANANRRGFLGTPIFAAPEMIGDGELGAWTDVYLLGATLHWVLTERPRHDGTTMLEVLTAAAKSDPASYNEDVPLELAELANRSTSLDRSARPEDALAFRAAIATHLEHTASLALTKDGQKRLAEMEEEEEGAIAATATAKTAMDKTAAAAKKLRLATEARFAFKAALDRWPENPEAIEGLRDCLEKAVHIEIDRENLIGARELEEELAKAGCAGRASRIVERREALERLIAERARSATELQQLRDDASLSRGGRERMKMILAILVISTVAIPTMSYVLMGERMMSSLLLLAPLILGLVVAAGLVWWLRRGLLANVVGRRVTLTFFLLIVFLGLHRSGTLLFPIARNAAEVRSELLLAGAVVVALGTFITRRAWLIAAVPVLASLLVTALPEHAVAVFNVAGLLSLVVSAFAFSAAAREAASSKP